MDLKPKGAKVYSNFSDEDEKAKQRHENTEIAIGKNELPIPRPSERHVNRMTIKEEETALSRLEKIALGMILPPVVIFISGAIAFWKTNKHFLVFPPFVSLIALCATLCAYFGAKYTKQSLIKNETIAIKWNSLGSQDFLTSSLYILHLTASCYFFIGIISFISHEILLGPIDDPSVSQKVKWLLFLISGASLKYIIGYIYIFYLACKLSIDYQSIHNYVQVVQISLLIASLGLIICPGIYWWYWSTFDISEELSPVIIQAGIAAGCCLLAYSLFSFFAAFKEHISFIIISQIVCVIMFIFLGLYCMLIIFSTEDFLGSFNTNCYSLLNMMQDKHLGYIGCSSKYLDVQTSAEDLNCPEDQIVKILDKNIEKYACLNSECCEVISTSASAGLDFIVGFCITGQILLIFALECTRNLAKKIEKFGRDGDRFMDKRLFGVIITVLLISLAIGYALK